jgi:hypothetical protein
MKFANIVQKATALTVIAGLSAWPSLAQAQETTVVTQPQPQPVVVAPQPTGTTAETRRVTTGPDMGLIGTGLAVFGVTYGTSVIVAAASDHQGDDHLYVPIAGPWMDFADRGGCGDGRSSCDSETTVKVFLALDGIFQAVGVLTMIGGVLHPQTKTVTETRTAMAKKELTKPTLRLTPAHYNHGYGLAAVGTF